MVSMETTQAIATVHDAICGDICQGACRTAVKALNSQLPEFVESHKLARINVHDPAAAAHDGYDPSASQHQPVTTMDSAHVITSDTGHTIGYPGWAWGLPAEEEPMHRPVLDIDFPAALIPSTTPGHFHLYLDKPMGWSKYRQLLGSLSDAGIIEQGYANASADRGYTSVRLPWVKKESYQQPAENNPVDWAA